MTNIRVTDIKGALDEEINSIMQNVIKKTGINKKDVVGIKVSKKAIDARDKNNIHFVYSFDIAVKSGAAFDISKSKIKNIKSIENENMPTTVTANKDRKRPVIAGSGPAGMFAALELAQAGLRPIIIERGDCVQKRKQLVDNFWNNGELNVSTNALFGEGGAGTFSDGKLTTGIKDVYCTKILKQLAEFGADEEILYLSKPHIGTDVLYNVVQNIRKRICDLGGEYFFNTKLAGLVINDNEIKGIKIESATHTEIEADALILAIGHSARDTYEMLYESGLHMEEKPFSVGVRIEHNQQQINISQYGKFYNHPNLGAADYKLAVHMPNGRGAYTFCMCPGGYVTACSSEKNTVVTNGMSYFKRGGTNANSALLIGVGPKDFDTKIYTECKKEIKISRAKPFRGISFQQEIEKLAYELGGGNYYAPVQMAGDFINAEKSKSINSVIPTYKPGFTPTNLTGCLPDFITESIREAIVLMDRKLKGFAAYDAILTGVETRSSSPVRILRDKSSQSNIKGIFPCGEGAGYAGGIMSAASDGIKCAQMLMNN